MFQWTEEELREMAAADAAIDSERQALVDMEMSRRLEQQARDDRRDNAHQRKLEWQREYYRKNREKILEQNRASVARTGYARKRDPERNKASCADWYARNRDRVNLERRQRRAEDSEYRERCNQMEREGWDRNKEQYNARRRQRRAEDPEFRDRVNEQKQSYYQKNRDRIRAYQKQYYQDNRERILKQRQQRYLRDEKFREANNARSKAWYHKHKKKKEGDAL